MRIEIDALLFEQTVAGVVGRDSMGRDTLTFAAVPVYQLPQRRGCADRFIGQLVAGCASDCLVETVEVWAGLRGQSRERRQPGSPPVQQKRNTDDGRHADRPGAEFYDAPLGAVEPLYSTQPIVGRSVDRIGLLRRLRKNYSTD